MFKRAIILLFLSNLLIQSNISAFDFEDVGDFGQYALPVSAALLSLKDQDLQGSVRFGGEYSLTVGIVHVLKRVMNEKRPNHGKWSFPSGHTASAFTGAMYIQRKYGWSWAIPAYVGAAAVGYSRIHAKKHWMKDVCAGATIAIASNFFFYEPFENMMVTPYFDGDEGGFSFTLSY